MSRKDSPSSLSVDRIAPYDGETTQPISMQLIARLAAQDPTVQLKIGVVAPLAAEAIETEEKTAG